MSTNPVTIDADATSLAAAQANIKASAIAQCTLLNGNLKSIYLTAFNNWKISVDAGRIDNTNPPQPPKSYVPVEAPLDAEGLGGSGWFFAEQVGPAVCDVPPIPEDRLTPKPTPPPMNIDMGHSADNGGGHWFTVGDNDSYPVGKQTPPMEGPPDGQVHVYLRVGTAVGKGWYERVA